VKDPQKPQRERFRSEEVNVGKIIGVNKLTKNYKSFDEKRKLCDSYELFLADDRVWPILPKMLGNPFYNKKKLPVSVKIGATNLKKCMRKATNATYFFLGNGPTSSLKVARISFSPEEIAKNVLACVEGILDAIPQRAANIQALSIKTNDSLALPIYNSLPEEMAFLKQAVSKTDQAADKADAKGNNAKEPLQKKRKGISSTSSQGPRVQKKSKK